MTSEELKGVRGEQVYLLAEFAIPVTVEKTTVAGAELLVAKWGDQRFALKTAARLRLAADLPKGTLVMAPDKAATDKKAA